jgi:hypothetical protein
MTIPIRVITGDNQAARYAFSLSQIIRKILIYPDFTDNPICPAWPGDGATAKDLVPARGGLRQGVPTG